MKPAESARRTGQPETEQDLRSREDPEGLEGKRQVGRVYLVGAGPGDPGLLTVRALELIAQADTILYDRLIPSQALAGAPAEAELLFVGKQGGGESVPQEQTEALMIQRALAGRQVVRLKGGDPFVFGRGGEEAWALKEAGIDFQVVPGVTAGVAAAAYAGIPVTHRGLATAVAFVTGHTREVPASSRPEPGNDGEHGASEALEPELDWKALASFPGTLVFYMGVRALPRIARSLIAAGRPSSQPAALVERATLPNQRTVIGTLATIADLAIHEGIKAPAITIAGDVVELGQDLTWLKERPLAGLSVAVTRARAQASGLAAHLEDLGAIVVQAPTIRVRELSDPSLPPLDPSPYDLVCLTSANGVNFLFRRLAAAGLDARALAGARIAAIGPATVAALAEHGIVADIVPARALAESLVEALSELEICRALLATASGARETLAVALREQGVPVDVLALYETVAEPLSASALAAARQANYITFTSSSSVRFFVQAAGRPTPEQRLVSIGPITSATLAEHGLRPHVEAHQHDVEGLVEALLMDAKRENQ